MTQTLIDIARAIVENPDDVRVVERRDGSVVHLELSVHPDDMGRVIGKGGRIAKAIRTVMKAAANSSDKRVNVEIK